MANRADPDQFRSQLIYTVCRGRTYPCSAGLGLKHRTFSFFPTVKMAGDYTNIARARRHGRYKARFLHEGVGRTLLGWSRDEPHQYNFDPRHTKRSSHTRIAVTK